MIVKFFAYYRDNDFAGCKEISMQPVKTLKELGEVLSERYGEKFRNEYFDATGTAVGERTIILVNGRRVEFLNGINTELKDEDTVQIFPVVAGG
ncbi:MAG: MoaD/ThiS family protein [Clostridiales bacterium]|nr:MoaD/ThiS family protein [Candidatus Crickella equi]